MVKLNFGNEKTYQIFSRNGGAQVRVQWQGTDKATITLRAINGRQQVQGSADLNLEQWPAGIYILQLQIGNTIITEKIQKINQ